MFLFQFPVSRAQLGDDCLDEELETVDAEVADGGDVELGSGSSLRRSAANGLCLTTPWP